MALREQMEMFEDGGLKDEGGMVDEVSGNDVPTGSTREEVRDDIPAQLSEGEFVFPADVVRYIGLEKLMQLRQQAKQGLKQMEAMGQMGNADEATMPDDLPFNETDLDTDDNDLPFDETDLDIEDDLEYNTGGVIEGQQEVYAPGNFDNLVNSTPTGAPKTQSVRYYNEQTKQVRMIPHLLNADGSLGNTIYPVPKGFVPQEAPEEKPVAQGQQSGGGRQKPQEDNNNDDDPTGDLGGARTTIGDVEYAIQYNFDGTVGLQSLDNYKATGQRNFQPATKEIAEAIKTQTTGQLAQLGKVKGLQATVIAELGKKMGIETPRYDKLGIAINKAKDATTFLKNQKQQNIFDLDKALKDGTVKDPVAARVDDLSRAQVISLDEGIRTGTSKENRQLGLKASDIAKQAEQDRLDKEKKEEEKKQRQISLAFAEQKRARQRIAKNKAAQEKAEREGRITGREAGQSMGGSDDGGYSKSDDFDSNTGFGSDISTAVGGLIPKKKKNTKKMKRGGLASKK
tara:strand:+ start:126 stop:1661 length:1536 start_codon:yes stop_codon:yes gene_type:complete